MIARVHPRQSRVTIRQRAGKARKLHREDIDAFSMDVHENPFHTGIQKRFPSWPHVHSFLCPGLS